MTSTISSTKTNSKSNSLLKLVKCNLLSNLPLISIYTLALFIILIVGLIMIGNNAKAVRIESYLSYIYSSYVQEMTTNFLSKAFAYILPCFISVFTIIVCASLFSVYHNKRKLDMYASMPVTKANMFLSRYITGILIVLIPLIILSAISFCLANALFSVSFSDIASIISNDLINMVVTSIAIFSMYSFFCMICGTVVHTLIAFMSINLGYPLIVTIIIESIYQFIPGMSNYYDETLSYSSVIGTFSPLLGANYQSFTDTQQPMLLNIIFWIVISVVFTVLAVIFSKKFKSEYAQESFLYPLAKYIIMFFTVTACGITVGYISLSYGAYDVSPIILMFVFIFFSTLASFVLITLIFNKTVKGIIKYSPIFISAFIITTATYLIIGTGAFGMDTYVPNVDDIESISFEMTDEYDTINIDNMDIDEYMENYGDWFFDSSSGEKVVKTKNPFITDRDVIENTAKAHKLIVDDIHEKSGGFYLFKDDKHYSDDNYIIFLHLEYTLKNGKKVERTYLRSDYKEGPALEYLNKAYSSDAYKNQYLVLNQCSVKDIKSFELEKDGYENAIQINNRGICKENGTLAEADEDVLNKFIDALKTDIKNNKKFFTTNYNLTENTPYCIIVEYDNSKYNNTYACYDYGYSNDCFNITEADYPNVWKLIQENQKLYDQLFKTQVDSITPKLYINSDTDDLL